MRYKIRWTLKAEQTFAVIIEYLEQRWSEKEVRIFIREVNQTLKRIAAFPNLFKASSSNPVIRKGFITKQCSLFRRLEMKPLHFSIFGTIDRMIINFNETWKHNTDLKFSKFYK